MQVIYALLVPRIVYFVLLQLIVRNALRDFIIHLQQLFVLLTPVQLEITQILTINVKQTQLDAQLRQVWVSVLLAVLDM